MSFLSILQGQDKPPAAPPPIGPPSGDPLDSAMDAAGIGADPAGAGAGTGAGAGAGTGKGTGETLDDRPTGEALIAFVESWVPLLIRGYAVANGREWNREMDAACRLSITEKANLKMSADAAAPYVKRLIDKSEKLAALAFAIQLGFILVGKFHLVKQQPLVKKAADVERQSDGAEAPQAAAPAERPPSAPVHRRPVGRPRGK